jgi:mono/diheme cytochrome c family protein
MRLYLLAVLIIAFTLSCKKEASQTKESTETNQEKTAPVKLTSSQQLEAKKVYEAWCSGCHGEKGRADGPAAAVLEVKPRNFIREPFKIRSTESGQPPTRKDIYETVTRGLPGTAMPSFSFLSEKERWLAADYVRKLANMEHQPDPPSIQLGDEPKSNAQSIQRGKQVYAQMGCAQCHGPTGRGDGPSAATLKDSLGRLIPARDYSRGEYLGGDTASAINMRFQAGIDGTPMPSYKGAIKEDQSWDLTHYVLSLREPKPASPSDPVARGRALVQEKQCFGCHVIEGEGADVGPSLDIAASKLRYDYVRSYLKDPLKHGKLYRYMPYRMPQFNLKNDEIEAIVALFANIAKRDVNDPVQQVPSFDQAKVSQGQLLYFLKCTECHNMGSVIPTPEAKQQGPDLITVSDRLLYRWMPVWVNNPKQLYPAARMIDTNLTQQEIDAVVAFVWKTSVDAHNKK